MSGNMQVHYTVGYRTPIIGQAWAVVRRRIHAEIRIYIDALVHQQMGFNTHIARALSRLVENLNALAIKQHLAEHRATQREQEAVIAKLSAQVQALQARVDELEGRLLSQPEERESTK